MSWSDDIRRSLSTPVNRRSGMSPLQAVGFSAFSSVGKWIEGKFQRSLEEGDHETALGRKSEHRTIRDWFTLGGAAQAEGVFHDSKGLTALKSASSLQAQGVAEIQNESTVRTVRTLLRDMTEDGGIRYKSSMFVQGADGKPAVDAQGNMVLDAASHPFLGASVEGLRSRFTQTPKPEEKKSWFQNLFSFGDSDASSRQASIGGVTLPSAVGGMNTVAAVQSYSTSVAALGTLSPSTTSLAKADTGNEMSFG
jgi:hypothetical protein